MNVKTPAELIESSEPDTVKTISSPSSSVAETVPMEFWFSAALKVDPDEKTGAISFRFVIAIVKSCEVELTPSVAVTVAV